MQQHCGSRRSARIQYHEPGAYSQESHGCVDIIRLKEIT